jgi:hypothetical protein
MTCFPCNGNCNQGRDCHITLKEDFVADITKCKGYNCPQKETCWRYRAPRNEFWQSWFSENPWNGVKCLEYWEMKKVQNDCK